MASFWSVLVSNLYVILYFIISFFIIRVCSRREAEKWIAAGRITVNDEPVKHMSATISASDADKIRLDGAPLTRVKFQERPRLFAIHKIRGEGLTDTDPTKKRPQLLDRAKLLLGPTLKLSSTGSHSISSSSSTKSSSSSSSLTSITSSTLKPVLWLDFQTEGLCLLTNNGMLAKLMNDPRHGLTRSYRARVHGLITESKLCGLRRGMSLEGIKYNAMDVTLEKTANTISWMHLRMTHSRPHQIQKTFKALHLSATRLICTEIGQFSLTDVLPRGTAWAELQIPPAIFSKLR